MTSVANPNKLPRNLEDYRTMTLPYGESLFSTEVFDDHVLIETDDLVVSLENVVDGEDADLTWDVYQNGYRGLNASTLSRQNLHRNEFLSELTDPSIIKYVARKKDGTPVGVMSVEKGIFRDPSPYWDPQDDKVFEAIQTETDPNAPSFYISTFVVDKSAESGGILGTSKIILEGALLHFEEVCNSLNVDSLCFFDFAPKNSFLPSYIVNSGEATDDFKGVKVDISPVYYSEWYRIPVSNFTGNGLRAISSDFSNDAFCDSERPSITEDLPLYIQPENLEGKQSDYCTVYDLASIVESREENIDKLLTKSKEYLPTKKFVLANVKRMADPSIMDPKVPLDIGERISYQTFSMMKLVR